MQYETPLNVVPTSMATTNLRREPPYGALVDMVVGRQGALLDCCAYVRRATIREKDQNDTAFERLSLTGRVLLRERPREQVMGASGESKEESHRMLENIRVFRVFWTQD
jgi:hypothetical protein